MRAHSRLLFLTLLVLATGSTFAATKTQVRLLLSADTARPGDTVTAAIQLKMASGWHTYWRNGGDSGGPTEVAWKLPAGITAGELQWPAPEKLVQEPVTTYVYHDEAVLLVPLKLAADLKPGPQSLKATVSWLECEELCVPGSADVSATLTIGSESKPAAQAALIEEARKKLPQTAPRLPVRVQWEAAREKDTRPLVIEWELSDRPTSVDFYPHTGEGYDVQAATEKLPEEPGKVRLRKLVKKSSGDWPSAIGGVLVAKYSSGRTVALEGKLEFANATAAANTAQPAPASRKPITAASLALHLLLALGGGLVLNLMPCVLPILSLKVLSIVKQSGSTAAEKRKHSLIYALGVLCSFWLMSVLVVAGAVASWGEQFQDARFVVLITVLMTMVALNLFGVFEFVLPGQAVGTAAELASREGSAGAFFNGVLAVVLGASCVAPMLAAAIGWAIFQPPWAVFLIFTMIGLGLALPFVILSFFPQLQGVLPKPGAWMEKFKIAMGFPMLATAFWLLTLTESHYGIAGVLWVGLSLVLLALAAWIYGQFIQRGGTRKGLAGVLALLCLLAGYGYALEYKLRWRQPPAAIASSASLKHGEDGIDWQPWSAEAVARARSAGQPVLVDFTANWCLTCKFNKETSLEIESVRNKLKAIKAVALLGDYTRKDPAITAELQRFERAGVPLVLVYPKDAAKPPAVLPTLLTPSIVLEALDQAVR